MSLITSDLLINKAQEDDWDSILNLLEESKMTFWLIGYETYKNYYIGKDKDNNIILCFAIDKNKDAGILRSFTIKKGLQGKGIGKYIVNNLISPIAKDLKIKVLYLLADNKEPYNSYKFWKKTIFSELIKNEKVSEYFQTYLDEDAEHYPDFVKTRAVFYLQI